MTAMANDACCCQSAMQLRRQAGPGLADMEGLGFKLHRARGQRRLLAVCAARCPALAVATTVRSMLECVFSSVGRMQLLCTRMCGADCTRGVRHCTSDDMVAQQSPVAVVPPFQLAIPRPLAAITPIYISLSSRKKKVKVKVSFTSDRSQEQPLEGHFSQGASGCHC
jgi:hypothetical protein